MADSPSVQLRPGRERSVHRGHPWVLSGAIARVQGDPGPGALVSVSDAQGRELGSGDYDPAAQLRVRILQFGEAPLPADWLEHRLAAALAWRGGHPELAGTDALRLVNAEADDLPGLVVDRYADWLAVRPSTPGMEARRDALARALAEQTSARGAWVRGSQAPGPLFGSVPDEPVRIEERGRAYWVDLRHGQKTGFYLDQRDARDRFQALARGARVLDLFAYSGGFSVAALAGGAREVVAVESSKPAAELLRRNAPAARLHEGDVNAFLRAGTDPFDLIAVDPPPFARRKRDVPAAGRAYKDLHLHVLARAAPGAHVLTFTCSHHVGPDLFTKLVFGAALDARRQVQVLATLGAPVDHPVSIRNPQGAYLSGLLLRVGGAV